jgi:neutral ceramidase
VYNLSRMTALKRLSFLALFCGSLALPAQALQAGVASVDITPKESIWLGGYGARTHPSQGIRQHIFAKALALRGDDGTTAILVTADLLGFTREITDSIAARVEQQHHIPRRLLLFNASHTHSAPVIGKSLKPTYPMADADRTVIARYADALEEQLVGLIGQSIGNLRPAQLSFAQGLAGLAVNRRRTGNPEYPGVIDPDVPVLVVRGDDGAIRAIVFGYACHNTTLDDYLVSGDWAGYAQQAIETQFQGAVAMYVQGCGADANPLPRRTEELAIAHGKLIAAAVSEVVKGKMRPVSGPIQAAYREVDLPLETPPSREEFEKRAATGSEPERRHARLMLQLMANGSLPLKHAWQAQVWKIGANFTFLALGGEVVADYALRFKRQYGFPNLWVAGYSNDVFAYIPSRRVWEEGGYEGGGAMIPYGLPARFQSSVEDIIVEAVSTLMQSVK